MARWTSSNSPRRTNSGLPPKNSIWPFLRRPSRNSISMYSSAGTAMKAMRPASDSRTSDWVRAVAAPSIMAIWQWCPQAWAAPVSGSAWGCSATIRESNSPRIAKVGPAEPPKASARTPVTANPFLGCIPNSANFSATSLAVLSSRNPGSGFFSIVWAKAVSSSALESMISAARRFRSSFEGIGPTPYMPRPCGVPRPGSEAAIVRFCLGFRL